MPDEKDTMPNTSFALCVAAAMLFAWNVYLTVHVAKYNSRVEYGQLNTEWLGYVYNSTGDNAARIYVLERQLGVVK